MRVYLVTIDKPFRQVVIRGIHGTEKTAKWQAKQFNDKFLIPRVVGEQELKNLSKRYKVFS